VYDTTREEERSCEQARSSDGSKKPAARSSGGLVCAPTRLAKRRLPACLPVYLPVSLPGA